MVRAGSRGVDLEDFLSKGRVAAGYGETGDLTTAGNREAIRARVQVAHPGAGTGKISAFVGCLHKMRSTIAVGDAVLTYDPAGRIYHAGVVRGPYTHAAGAELDHERKVEWLCEVPRDELSAPAKFSLGSTLTVFTVKDFILEEIRSLCAGERPASRESTGPQLAPQTSEDAEEEEAIDPVAEALELAHEYRKDAISALGPNEMEDFVACVLRGMGYRARVTPRGPDRGRDIEASPDGLGLEEPRIRVEVKHRQAKMGAQEVRAFLGALRPGDKGLYVSTGGFSREAMYEAERSQVPASLVDLDRLAELYVEFYEELKPEDRELVPLRRVYWPEGRG